MISHTISGKPMWFSRHALKTLVVPHIIDTHHVKINIPLYTNYHPYILYILYHKHYHNPGQIISSHNSHDLLKMHYSGLPYVPIILSYSYPSLETVLREIDQIQDKKIKLQLLYSDTNIEGENEGKGNGESSS
jgi:hypothetical protein